MYQLVYGLVYVEARPWHRYRINHKHHQGIFLAHALTPTARNVLILLETAIEGPTEHLRFLGFATKKNFWSVISRRLQICYLYIA